jgi:hypothetical protein
MSNNNDNPQDPFGLPNADKYDATTVARKRYGPDNGPWDPEYGGLDLHGYGIGSKQLKAYLEAAAEETDPNRPRRFKLRANGREISVQVFKRGETWVALAPVKNQWMEFRERSYDDLVQLLLETFNKGPRELTERERLTIARLCVPGPDLQARMLQALGLYLRYRCGEQVDESILNDPSFAAIVNDGFRLIFVCSEPGFRESREAWNYMEAYRGRNRQWSIPLLKAAWKSYTENPTAAQPINEQSEAPRVTEADLIALNDEAIASLYGGVVSKNARDFQRLRDRWRSGQ